MVKFPRVVTALSLALFLAVGCGGGGGGSSDDNGGGGGGGGGGGDTTPMTITAASAPEAAATAEVGTSSASGMSGMAPQMLKVGVGASGFNGAISTALSEVNAVVGSSLAGGSARVSNSFTIPPQTQNGACGGSMTMTATLDDPQTPTSVSGTLAFSNYNDCDETLSGTVSFSGTGSTNTVTSSVTFTNFVSVSGSVTATVNGTITSTEARDGSSASASITITMSNGTDTIMMDHYNTSMVKAGADATVNVNGTIALNNNSFVVSTVTPLYFVNVDYADHPTTGQIVLDANGRARVTYLTATTVRVEVDTNEDGTYDTPAAFEGTWDALYTQTGF